MQLLRDQLPGRRHQGLGRLLATLAEHLPVERSARRRREPSWQSFELSGRSSKWTSSSWGTVARAAVAITAKETDPSLKVLAVDKGSVGYSGKANKGGGHCAFIPEGGEETYVEYHTRKLGDYLNDQELLRKYANSTRDVLADVERWGAKVYGKEAPFNAHPMIPWKVTTVDLDFMLAHAKYAQSLGVEFMDKVAVVDLLTDGGKVVGAIGFSLLDGKTFVFKAKAVVLANGCQNWRIMRMWPRAGATASPRPTAPARRCAAPSSGPSSGW